MLLESLPVLDEPAMEAAARRQGVLAKPEGALGRLEGLSVWLSGVQGICPPRALQRPRVVIFAGDHGVAGRGVSAFPAEVTAHMVATFAAGGGAVNVIARLVGATVRVEDMAVGRPSGSIDRADALTHAEALEAYEIGRGVADAEIDEGADLLIAGEMGIGNTTPAAVLCGAITGDDPAVLVGRGTGIDDNAWMRKAAAVRDALRRVRDAGAVDDPIMLLAVAGGADLAAMTGFLIGAAARRTPVLLDGLVSCVAALVADRIAPGIAAWQVAASTSPEPAQALALQVLRHQPLLDLGMHLDEGTGALMAVPILQAAITTLAEMATLEEAGISGAPAPRPTAEEINAADPEWNSGTALPMTFTFEDAGGDEQSEEDAAAEAYAAAQAMDEARNAPEMTAVSALEQASDPTPELAPVPAPEAAAEPASDLQPPPASPAPAVTAQ